MKFRILYTLFTLLGVAFLLFNNSSGPAEVQGQDRTGSPLSSAPCQACHSSGAFSPTIELELLQDGAAISEYTPGEAYTMRVTAGFSGSPEVYGFQAVALAGEDDAQAGDFDNPGNGIQITDLNGREYPEHSQRSNSNVFEVEWVAPAAGTGDVRFYSAVVTANNAAGSGGDGSTFLTEPVVITEGTASSRFAPESLEAELALFPNPAATQTTLAIEGAVNGTYQVDLLGGQGQLLSRQVVQARGGNATVNLPMQAYPAGLYFVRVSLGERTAVRRLLKN